MEPLDSNDPLQRILPQVLRAHFWSEASYPLYRPRGRLRPRDTTRHRRLERCLRLQAQHGCGGAKLR